MSGPGGPAADDLVRLGFEEATGIATIRLNRPHVLNAIDAALAKAFRAAVEEICAREGVRCIVLAAEGRAFMAGGDVASFAGGGERSAAVVDAILDAMHPALLALRAQDAPVIASVQGVAAGAGFSLVLGADLVIAAEGTRFLLAYERIGASPDCGATFFLERRLGAARAAGMMFLSDVLDADAARAAGLVNMVVPLAELATATEGLAKRVADGPTRAFGAYRRLVDRAAGGSLGEHLEAERAEFLVNTARADFREGTRAFVEKRPAVFSGR